MLICKNISLKPYNTFGLDYMAHCIIHVRTEKEASAIFRKEIAWKKPLLIIGGGSNILYTCNFKGTIIKPEFRGIKIVKQEDNHVIVSAGAGVPWDRLVEWSVEKGFGGLENLSDIPGLVGASPVQNIGAYGTEAKDTIIKVRTLCVEDGSLRIFNKDECGFGYRTSFFKTSFRGKYLVTRVYFRLTTISILNLGYGSLKEEVENLGKPNLKHVRQAVIKIRGSKLPDPEIIGNAGSFFRNPVVSRKYAGQLKKKFPQISCYDDPSGGIKLAAGWLIEQCGWKGKRNGDAGVHEKQALVIVNHGKATGKEIFDLSEKIKVSVREKFDVNLEREVEVI